MTNEEALKILKYRSGWNLSIRDVTALNMAIEALELCEDTISRQDALEALEQEEPLVWCDGADEIAAYNQWSSDVDTIKNIPPVQPKPKTERCKWIRYDYRTICPKSHDIDNPYWRIPENRMDALKYCPYCGNKIEVTE